MKKSTNKFIGKYDIKDIEEMLCGGKCPEEEDVSCTISNFNKNFKYRSGVKDLLTDEDENNEHVRLLLKVDHKEAVGVKKELILKMIRKNPRIRLTFLKFEKKCFNTFIKKLLERVPSPDAESILEKRTEECLTPQPTIANNFFLWIQMMRSCGERYLRV